MTHSAQMFLRPHQRNKDGKDHTYWSLVGTLLAGYRLWRRTSASLLRQEKLRQQFGLPGMSLLQFAFGTDP